MRSTRSPPRMVCLPRAWPGAPGWTRPRSIRPSGGCPTAATAGPAPKASPRCWMQPAPAWRPSPRWFPAPARLPATPAPAPRPRRVPLIGFAQAGSDGFFDDGGYPVGGGWDEVIAAGNRRSQRLCAGDQRRFDGTGVPRRRHGDRLALGADTPRRPGGGADRSRRGDGQAARPPLRPPHRAAQPQPGAPQLQLRPESR